MGSPTHLTIESGEHELPDAAGLPHDEQRHLRTHASRQSSAVPGSLQLSKVIDLFRDLP